MAAILSTSFAAAVTDWAATWSLASVTGVQVGHLCAAESELAQVTKVGPGTTVTVRRGVEATSAAAHATNTPIAVYRAEDVRVGAPVVVTGAVALRQAAVTLAHAQLLALATTTQTLLAPPGPNKLNVVTAIALLAHFVTPYTGLDQDGDNLLFRYFADPRAQVTSLFNAGTGSNRLLYDFVTNAGGVGSDHVTHLILPQSQFISAWGENAPANHVARLSDRVNQPVYVKLTGTIGGGGAANTLTISLLYGIVDVTTGVWV